MQVTLTQDAIIDGRRFPAGANEMTEDQAKSARALGVEADPEPEADPELESGDVAPEQPKPSRSKKASKTNTGEE